MSQLGRLFLYCNLSDVTLKLDWEFSICFTGCFLEEVVFIFLFLCSYLFFVCYIQCLVYELLTFVLSVRGRSLPDFACLSQLESMLISVPCLNFQMWLLLSITPCIFVGCYYFLFSLKHVYFILSPGLLIFLCDLWFVPEIELLSFYWYSVVCIVQEFCNVPY